MAPDRSVLDPVLRVLWAGVALACVGSAAASSLDEVADWQPFDRSERMGDGSVLTEYAVRTRAFDGVPARLELSFSPRFGCEPMIGFVLDDSLEPSRDEAGALEVRIDGVRFDWPDRDGARPGGADDASERSAWLFADRELRRTARLRIDGGDLIALRRVDAAAITFSLLGSRDGVAVAEAACRAHEPLPYDGL